MGWYGKFVVPRLIDLAMRGAAFLTHGFKAALEF
jgi:hypothetical protein